METDHIAPRDDGGGDDIGNAIPVCFECHAEIHSYNDKHPRGRKFRAEELRIHKEQWLRTCEEHPDVLLAPSCAADVGPLQALIDELALNAKVAEKVDVAELGSKFHEEQLRRAIGAGSIAIVREEIREAVLDAYVAMSAANQLVEAAWTHPKGSNSWAKGVNEAQPRIVHAGRLIAEASRLLLSFLGSEPDAA